MKQCTNCRGNLADFVEVCPYCHVAQPVPQAGTMQPDWTTQPHTSNKAIASLVCGILFMCAPASIAAVILGHVALSDIKRSAGRIAGQGMAIAGLVMGYVGIALSTVYVLVVVFAVKNAMSQNVPVNETAAIATLRTYDSALKAYAAKCPQQGYPSTLVSLGPGIGNCTRANLIDMKLAGRRPIKLGYQFEYTAGVHGSDKVTVFALVARPVQPGLTGKRYFYLDEAGIVRQSPNQAVGPNSDSVDTPDAQSDSSDDDGKNQQ